jgi:hypothetical protein
LTSHDRRAEARIANCTSAFLSEPRNGYEPDDAGKGGRFMRAAGAGAARPPAETSTWADDPHRLQRRLKRCATFHENDVEEYGRKLARRAFATIETNCLEA